MAAITFPNYTQIPSRLSLRAWRAVRATSLVAALIVAALLVAIPDTGLFVMWKVVIPALPLLFMVAPGLWRNICPLATSKLAIRLNVPWRTYSNSIRSGWSGCIGWVAATRSSAWIPVISSQLITCTPMVASSSA